MARASTNRSTSIPYSLHVTVCTSCGRESDERFAFCPFCGSVLIAAQSGDDRASGLLKRIRLKLAQTVGADLFRQRLRLYRRAGELTQMMQPTFHTPGSTRTRALLLSMRSAH